MPNFAWEKRPETAANEVASEGRGRRGAKERMAWSKRLHRREAKERVSEELSGGWHGSRATSSCSLLFFHKSNASDGVFEKDLAFLIASMSGYKADVSHTGVLVSPW